MMQQQTAVNDMNTDCNGGWRGAPATARGVTLIELLIVLVIMAILATTAITSYRNYTMRANRTEGRMALLAIQTAQERFFLQNNTYATSMATVTAAPPGGLGVALGSGNTTANGNYVISFTVATPTAYTVQAAANGGQTADTHCPTLSIDQNGTRTPAAAECWR